MTKTLQILLVSSALLPMSAFAQDATTTPVQPETPPLIQQDMGDQNATGGSTAETAPMPTDETETQNAETAPLPADEPTSESAETAPMPTDEPAVNSADQTDPAVAPATEMADASTTGDIFVTVPPTDAWRANDFIGKDVYGSDGESIGNVDDVILTGDGQVSAVIIGVGGFLGIGEKDVAVSMSALEIGPGATEAEAAAVSEGQKAVGTGEMATEEPAETADAADPAAAPLEPDTTGAVTAPEPVANDGAVEVEIGDDALPTRIVLNVTREELENAPAFEGIRPDKVEDNDGVDLVPDGQ